MNEKISLFIAIVLVLASAFIFLLNQKPPINSIEVQHSPSAAKLNKLGVFQWPTWDKEQSEFIWQYSELERAYVLQGEVLVTPEGSGESVLIKKGDLVTFAPGLRCRWQVKQPFKKHVTLADTPLVSAYWAVVFKAQGLLRRVRTWV